MGNFFCLNLTPWFWFAPCIFYLTWIFSKARYLLLQNLVNIFWGLFFLIINFFYFSWFWLGSKTVSYYYATCWDNTIAHIHLSITQIRHEELLSIITVASFFINLIIDFLIDFLIDLEIISRVEAQLFIFKLIWLSLVFHSFSKWKPSRKVAFLFFQGWLYFWNKISFWLWFVNLFLKIYYSFFLLNDNSVFGLSYNSLTIIIFWSVLVINFKIGCF